MLLKVVGTVAGWLASLALLATFAFFFLLYFNGLYGGGPALWGDRAPVMIASLVFFGVAQGVVDHVGGLFGDLFGDVARA